VAVVLRTALCQASSLVTGHFHPVTVIRGRVVGSGWTPFRWLRQSICLGDAKLTWHEYRWSRKIEDLKPVAALQAAAHRNFDFGSVPNRHYSLSIEVKDSARMGGFFDVEVTDAAKNTKHVRIDVSPIQPDCTSGHEFIETKS
jgi:hypothetical protein